MANKYKGEVAIPEIGKGYFIAFTLADIAALEAEFGRGYFDAMEQACLVDLALPDIIKILTIGLRKRNGRGEAEKVGEDLDYEELHRRDGFNYSCVCQPIMDAIAMSWLGKSHAELVADALEARKKQDAENLKRAAEAANEAGLPFNEALSGQLFNLLTHMASTPFQSGN